MGEAQQVDLVAAVVEAIAFPTITAQEDSAELERIFHDNDAAEGVSILLSDTQSAAPDLWLTRESPDQPYGPTIEQTCTLSFQCKARSEGVGASALSSTLPLWIWQRLQLPVANTLFQNGHSSTLLAQRWIPDTASTAEPRLLRVRNVRMPQQTLHITEMASSSPMVVQQIPLTAITVPRTVAASMGNILKRFDGPSSADLGESVPASTELEENVSAWIESQDFSGQRAMVWALVTPRELQLDDYISGNVSLQSAINSGSCLRKVLSGGGGWGQKKGLLALDPSTKHEISQGQSEYSFGSHSAIDGAQPPSFGEVVRPGDVVTFYIYNRVDESRNQSEDTSLPKSRKTSTLPSIVMATIPSTMDDMPILTSKNAGLPLLYARNHFGVASETMNLTIGRLLGEHKYEHDPGQSGSTVETKIDVPHTRCSIGNGAPYVLSDSPKHGKER